MSSIYKKGRDGYFYYQTYVYNDKTKKKNKRIFHSLGTKNELKAIKKKIELDKKYDLKNRNHFKLDEFWASNKKVVFILLFTAFTFILTTFHNKKKDVNLNDSLFSNVESKKIDFLMNDSNKTFTYTKINNNNQTTLAPDPKGLKNEATPILDYEVERVEKLSVAFKQGKIHVTINPNFNAESQRMLCVRLREKYIEFSNIIICLYSNSKDGLDLAKGINQTINTEHQKESWLAMYTYNKVEGEYFDNNPARFLGIN